MTPARLGATLQRAFDALAAGKLGPAAALLDDIARQAPDHPQRWHLTGLLAHLQHRHAQALDALRKAARALPDDPHIRTNLIAVLSAAGTAAQAEGRREDACALLEEALTIPRDITAARPAILTLARLYADTDRPAEAQALLARLLAADPGDGEALAYNADVIAGSQGPDAALTYLEAARRQAPESVALLNRLGLRLMGRMRYVEAEAVLKIAAAKDPDQPRHLANLAECHIAMGEADQGLELLRTAIARAPHDKPLHANLVQTLNYVPEGDGPALREEARRWATGLPRPPRPAPHAPDPERRLRIGYLSPDFYDHPAWKMTGALIEGHDRSAFEVFLYAAGPERDAVSGRWQALGDRWQPVAGWSAEAIAARIAEDRIDILVDCAGHTAHQPMAVFALRPAPLQVSHAICTTGLATIDFLQSDPHTRPAGDPAALYCERLMVLPDAHLPFRPPGPPPTSARPPAADRGAITFAAFNHLAKIGPHCHAAWATILDDLPDARLIIKSRPLADAKVRARLAARLAAAGLPMARVLLLGHLDAAAYGDLLREVDIALDSWPYNGAVTTGELLWHGVPVITVTGHHHQARVGACYLAQAGVRELATDSPEAYRRRAVGLARDLSALHDVRARILAQFPRAPMVTPGRITRDFEAALRRAWRALCAGRLDEED